MPGGNKTIFRRALSETSATASDLGTPGEIRDDTKTGKKYRLVYLAASAVDGAVLQFHSASGTNGYTVIVNAQTANGQAGVQNQALLSQTSDVYCWAQIQGMGSMSCAASIASFQNILATNAGGTTVATTVNNIGPRVIGYAIASVTTGNQLVFIDMAGG